MTDDGDLSVFFGRRARGICPFCVRPGPFEFRDALSRKEYNLSGLCQACQDKTFTDDETTYMAEAGPTGDDNE